ncbi:NAD(P)H-hydrate dehydratase [Microbacterium sp. R86528]|uniref:NAD(P)H-hydrate dehydratase n=1 Tax=Microbacterium sp. R86528 TaxID=3093864 RepID=UPI0037CA67D1
MDRTWTVTDVARNVRMPSGADDKYSRGVVGLRTGSEGFPGAAVLGVEAAWRTGVGMVRYLGPQSAHSLVLSRRPETVISDGRVQSWVVGSGMDAATRGRGETHALRTILSGEQPVVVDAGALDLARGATTMVVVTPHDGEHARMREALGLHPRSDRARAAHETASALNAVVLLKGSVTLVASPEGQLIRVDAPTAWLATAGTGDVLAGAVGALVASAVAAGEVRNLAALADIAASAAWLHGRAGEVASSQFGGGPITALDVAQALPRVVAEVLASR